MIQLEHIRLARFTSGELQFLKSGDREDVLRLQAIIEALNSAERFHDAYGHPDHPCVHEYGLARAHAEDMIRETMSFYRRY